MRSTPLCETPRIFNQTGLISKAPWVSSTRNRVAVTGVGVSSPPFPNAETFWHCVLHGGDHRHGEQTPGGRSHLPDTRFKEQKFMKFQDDTAKWALAATDEAVTAAGLRNNEENAGGAVEIGLSLGTCFGPLRWGLTHVYRSAVIDPNNPRVSCFSSVIGYYGSVIGNVTIPMGFHGPSMLFCNLETSGADAILYAYNVVRSGRCPMMVCGGADAPAPEMWERDGSGQKTDRKWGEGACVLLLETMEGAARRGAKVLAEVCDLDAGNGVAMPVMRSVMAGPDEAIRSQSLAQPVPGQVPASRMAKIAEAFGTGTATSGAAAAVAAAKIAEHAALQAANPDAVDLNYVMQPGVTGNARSSGILFRHAFSGENAPGAL